MTKTVEQIAEISPCGMLSITNYFRICYAPLTMEIATSCTYYIIQIISLFRPLRPHILLPRAL